MATKDFNHVPAVMRLLVKEEDRMAKDLASYVASRAKRHAPVLTGNLREKIHSQRVSHGNYEVVSYTKDTDNREYAAYNEYGTRYMRAQPYMAPATVDGRNRLKTEERKHGHNINRTAKTGRA